MAKRNSKTAQKVQARSTPKRDLNIALNSTMEINLGTRSIPSKRLYNRKKISRVDW